MIKNISDNEKDSNSNMMQQENQKSENFEPG